MRFVSFKGETIKKTEHQILVMLDGDRIPTEGFLKLLINKAFEVQQRPIRRTLNHDAQ